MKNGILVIGACGQIGTELTLKLRELYGKNQVIASDIKEGLPELMESGPFETLNALNYQAIEHIVEKHQINEVYLMAAILSVIAEKMPAKAWELNTNSLLNVLNLAKEGKIKKVFWPSSIAVFGPSTPKENTPQTTIMNPTTVYGISKLAGERWCEYYFNHYNVDVRSIRYPGIISWKTNPGGGTTDYAVEIFHEAIEKGTYTSFLDKNTKLPMMYMDDAIAATIQVMKADGEKLTIRSSYNLAAISFTPKEIATEIKTLIPTFKIEYSPDSRQEIANSWPQSIDDSFARKDWNWNHHFNLKKLTKEMFQGLKSKFVS